MNMLINSITLGETSYNVALLHKILAVLGLSVLKEEVDQHKAGPDTLGKVRALQKQLGIPVDDSTLVDDQTAAAIADALDKRGFTSAARSFTVSGTVRLPDGSPKKQQGLYVFDLDLGGITTYRTAKTLADIQ